jgi:hypothetical protein
MNRLFSGDHYKTGDQFMRTVDTLRQRLNLGSQGVHEMRLSQVFGMVAALLRGGQATLTAVGRAAATETTEKHGIKRADRCLGNVLLQREMPKFWSALAGLLLAGKRRPTLLVDWTETGSEFATLRAAIVLRGRALSIFSRVYPVRQQGNSRVRIPLHPITRSGRIRSSFRRIRSWSERSDDGGRLGGRLGVGLGFQAFLAAHG